MEKHKKIWYEVLFWCIFVVGALGLFYYLHSILTERMHGNMIFNERLGSSLTYAFMIMSLTFGVGFLLREHLSSKAFATLVVVCTVFFLVPNYFIYHLINGTDLSCDFYYDCYLHNIGILDSKIEVYGKFFVINPVMMIMLHYVEVDVLLLYIAKKRRGEVTLDTSVKISIIIGSISFLVIQVQQRIFDWEWLGTTVSYMKSVYVYSLIYFILLLFFLVWHRQLFDQRQKVTEMIEPINNTGLGVFVCCMLIGLMFILEKDRIFDTREYYSMHLFRILKESKIEHHIVKDLQSNITIILFELIVIWVIKKLIEKSHYLGILFFLFGISFFYLREYLEMVFSDGIFFNNTLVRLTWLVNPVQFIIATAIILIMARKQQHKKGLILKEIFVVICSEGIDYFYNFLGRGWIYSLYQERIEVFSTRTMLTIFLVSFICIMVMGMILLINEGKISFRFNKIEAVLDTLFLA